WIGMRHAGAIHRSRGANRNRRLARTISAAVAATADDPNPAMASDAFTVLVNSSQRSIERTHHPNHARAWPRRAGRLRRLGTRGISPGGGQRNDAARPYAGQVRRTALVSVVVALVTMGCNAPSARSPVRPGRAGSQATSRAATAATSTAVTKPRVVWKPIPFGAKRKREMAAYSKRHYGYWRWRLIDPHVIGEHY